MRVRILYAPPQTGYVCGSVIETADDEAAALIGSDLAEETDAEVTHDAPPVFYMAKPETAAPEPSKRTGDGAGQDDGKGKPVVDVSALESAAKKAADTLSKLKAAHAKETGRVADALAIKVAAAEKKLADANAAVVAAKGE